MRFLSLFLSILLLSTFLIAQQRYLVSPGQEVLPVNKYSSPSQEIAKRTARMASSIAANCTGTFEFGFNTNQYNGNNGTASRFGVAHKDVLGQWYIAKAAGTIDTVYWYHNDNTFSNPDTTVLLRMHKSNIGPNYGPGKGDYAAAPPCQSWGYWKTTTDADNGIGPFITSLNPGEDTSWFSTIAGGGTSVPITKPPFGEQIFGFATGMPIKVTPFVIMKADVAGTGFAPTIKKDDVFFVSFQPSFPNAHIATEGDNVMRFQAWGSDGPLATDDEMWPARNWKFYEHDSGPSPECAGVLTTDIKRGWVARGPLGTGATQAWTGLYNIWYSMTVTTNVPPLIIATEGGDPTTTFSNDPQTVSYTIYDCDSEIADSAGVQSAVISWSKSTITTGTEVLVKQPDIPLVYQGGDFWTADIPGQPAGTRVSYQIKATDIRGMEN
ncbi:MAG: hypothetical protein HY964_02965, partial [Ignavibacteriales bacterium]|nr:hypothetical protein [Ignavibacteriales bacterium]